MKIGIITLHYSKNYGAVLQAFALCEFLKMNGWDAEIINYCPRYAMKGWRLFINPMDYSAVKKYITKHGYKFAFKRILQIIKFDLLFYDRAKKYRKYRMFETRLALSNKYKTYGSLNKKIKDYGILISGSDQVWNPNLINGYDPVYFLDFNNWNGTRLAYAASAGIKNLIKTSSWDKMSLSLKKFDLISVREESLQEELSIAGLKSFVVVDPTLLVDRSVWYNLVADIKPQNSNYILVYALENNPDFQECLTKTNSANTLPIIDISPINNKINSEKDMTCGPLDFLNYIKNATYIVTDSFHGIVFSILFKKEFWCIKRKEMFGRIETLLRKTSLEDRIFDSTRYFSLDSEIDYDSVIHNIEILQNESRNILDEFIENCINNYHKKSDALNLL